MKSTEFDVPIILVGNLSTGGTGKTPHVEYILRLLKDQKQVATLSRGYGRKTPGFIQANDEHTAKNIGDEPLQFYTKFKPQVNVFVEANRVMGVIRIMSNEPDTEVIVLDDAYQHRAIKAGKSILLTEYNKPFYEDYILPVGNLRERRAEYKRADIVIITKCPDELSEDEMHNIKQRIKPYDYQQVYFSKIMYGDIKSFNPSFSKVDSKDLSSYQVVLVTGIANPKPLIKKLEKDNVAYKHLKFPDHHNFTPKNISNIIDIFDGISNEKKMILTTEKDAVRLQTEKRLMSLPLFFIGIEVELLSEKDKFDNQIINYVKQD